nr:MAG TPA: hypothetical protein [Caudoviricetes sp.]
MTATWASRIGSRRNRKPSFSPELLFCGVKFENLL